MLPTETDFEAQVSMETEAVPVPEDPPFHILFLDDFSGRRNLLSRGDTPPNTSKIFEIDRDNFDEVMKRMGARLYIEPAGEGTGAISLAFRSLDDFHPDAIFEQIGIFSDLRDVRQRLLRDDSFEAAAREVRSWLGESEEPVSEPGNTTPMTTGSVLDDILSSEKRDVSEYPSQHIENKELRGLVRRLVEPHLIRTDESEQAKLLAAVDGMSGDLMNSILHHPEFQSLEAAWRALYLVVRNTDTASDLKLFFYDISKDEVAEDLKSVENLADSSLFGDLAPVSPDGSSREPWALICGGFNFALTVDDSAALIRLGKMASISNCSFVSHVRPQMLGIESIAASPTPEGWNLRDESTEGKLWTMLRTSTEAPYLGLVLPRFLARLPYGTETDPIERFQFEELGVVRKHDHYLWANPAYVVALVLARSYRRNGWEIGGRYLLDLDGLPTHVFTEDGSTITKPCAEVEMTHEACDQLIDQGLMPLISFRDTDRVRLGGIQSIAFPSKDLKGRWS